MHGRCHCSGAVQFESRVERWIPHCQAMARVRIAGCAEQSQYPQHWAACILFGGDDVLRSYHDSILVKLPAFLFVHSAASIPITNVARIPKQYGINVACLEGVSPFDFAEVPVMDGVQHPSDDNAGKVRRAGTLRYERLDT